MTLLLIQPSYGNRHARAHWDDTIEHEVDFRDPRRWNTLTQSERAQLVALHPGGRARFWGATANHDAKMDQVAVGDVVVFTGGKLVRGIGEVGASFRNTSFADTLWDPDEVRGSFRNVYSLRTFEPAAYDYDVLRQALGSDPYDNFMGLRLIRDDRVAAVLDAFGISTVRSVEEEIAEARVIGQQLADNLGTDSRLPPEANTSTGGSYIQREREVVFTRVEALLVDAYRQSLPADVTVDRLRLRVGLTDLGVTSSDGALEVIEAKASADHRYVRQALGQILDYVRAATTPIARISVLFPSAPIAEDVAMLNHYGIDCVCSSRSSSGFERHAAPAERRRAVWHSDSWRLQPRTPS